MGKKRIKVYVNVYQNLDGDKLVFQQIHLSKEAAKKIARHREKLKYLFTLEYEANKLILME